MALKERFIPSDTSEDIKLGKIIPLNSLVWGGIALLGSMLFVLFLPFEGSLIKILIVFLSVFFTLFANAFKIPKYFSTLKKYKNDVKINNLDNFSKITEYETISKINNKNMLLLEYSPPPFEVMPDSQKDEVSDTVFAQNILYATRNDCTVSVFGLSCPENTDRLEARIRKLDTLPPALRKLENDRINYHFQILEKEARTTRYFLRLQKYELKDKSTITDDAYSFLNDGFIALGGDYVKNLVNTHLTPTAKVKRGR